MRSSCIYLLKVVMPSTPYDVKGLMIASIQDGNPVMFIEHRWLYEQIGYVPEELYTVPIGKGIVRKQGKDVTKWLFPIWCMRQ